MTGWQWHHAAGPYANHLHRQPRQRLITQFLQAGCSSWRPTNSVMQSTEGNSVILSNVEYWSVTFVQIIGDKCNTTKWHQLNMTLFISVRRQRTSYVTLNLTKSQQCQNRITQKYKLLTALFKKLTPELSPVAKITFKNSLFYVYGCWLT